jgi:hypothetical protein
MEMDIFNEMGGKFEDLSDRGLGVSLVSERAIMRKRRTNRCTS